MSRPPGRDRKGDAPSTQNSPACAVLGGLRRRLGGFMAERRGAVAIQFAFLALPLCILSFGLFDISRASDAKQHLQDALDAATLIAARSPGNTNAALQAVGGPALTGDLASLHDGTLTASAFTIDTSTASVTGTASMSVVPTVANLWLNGNMTVSATATVKRAMDYVEVALVLDNTGSMAQTLGSGTKITALKTAASSMVDTLSTAASNSLLVNPVKISVVPYTMTVNVGATNQTATWMSGGQPSAYGSDIFATAGTNRFTLFSQMGLTWGGCVEARPSPYDTSESPPNTTLPGTLYVPFFSPDEPGSASGDKWNNISWANNYLNDVTTSSTWSVRQGYVAKYNTKSFVNTPGSANSVSGYTYGPNAGCTITPLTRLTTNFTSVKTAINAMVVGGDTDIKSGVIWGWHTLSPNAPFNDGVAYGTPYHDKVMVLMTDGQNHNVETNDTNDSFYSDIGFVWQNRLGISSGTLAQRITVLNQKLAQTCSNAKAAGITMYVVVMVDSTVDQSTVKACATDPSKLFLVTDTNQLTGVFTSIAGNIGNLRISH
jgi:Flp pilus assembly protein TadG